MKCLNSVLVLALAIPLVSFADMPADAPGKLNDHRLWDRCNPESKEYNIPIEDIIANNKFRLELGCIGEIEFNYANAHGVFIGCVGSKIIAACKVNLEYPK